MVLIPLAPGRVTRRRRPPSLRRFRLQHLRRRRGRHRAGDPVGDVADMRTLAWAAEPVIEGLRDELVDGQVDAAADELEQLVAVRLDRLLDELVEVDRDESLQTVRS